MFKKRLKNRLHPEQPRFGQPQALHDPYTMGVTSAPGAGDIRATSIPRGDSQRVAGPCSYSLCVYYSVQFMCVYDYYVYTV